MKKRIPAIILMFALFLTTSYAANTYRKTIAVTSGVNVEFNNEAIDMTDANDKAVEAFIYNGTTYVPIRAVSNAFGADIGYDRNTQTISIYDDFSEVAAVAHGMSNILTGYSEAMFVGLAYVTGGEQESIQNMMDNMQTSNANMQSTLKYLSSDDGYNTCIGLLDDAVAKYNSAIASLIQRHRHTSVMYRMAAITMQMRLIQSLPVHITHIMMRRTQSRTSFTITPCGVTFKDHK